MSRERSILTSSKAEPGPETKAIRPNTGLGRYERDMAAGMVRRLMRARSDQLPPDAALTEADKDRIYADAAHALSAELHRTVTLDQIRLVAASMRTPNRPRRNYTVSVAPHHHAILRAEAEAQETHITTVLRSILDTHFELSREG
jgi:hypothetical protein